MSINELIILISTLNKSVERYLSLEHWKSSDLIDLYTGPRRWLTMFWVRVGEHLVGDRLGDTWQW